MRNYASEMLNRLLDIYERREGFLKNSSDLRTIQFDVKKIYPEYIDRYNDEAYRIINSAIENLCIEKLVFAEKNSSGQYTKVKLNTGMVEECYRLLKRVSIVEQCNNVKRILLQYTESDYMLIKKITHDWMMRIERFQPVTYDLRFDHKRIEIVTNVIVAILKLDDETYIRNFSTAVFRDSKIFRNEYQKTVESILFDFTDEIVEKERILEFYNLYENPTYVLIKGNAEIRFDMTMIYVGEMPDGIAISNASLEKIKSISVKAQKVITVENLTTYYDADDENAVYIYLGGYHNHSKQHLLEKLYESNRNKEYYHMGDLDVYGFLILENLKEKTGIPFAPLMMDLETIKKFYDAGIYKELTEYDKKMINEKKDTKLAAYSNVLQFMIDNNCKVEQESAKAIELLYPKEK